MTEHAMPPAETRTVVVTDRGGPNFLVRFIWYILIGWWLSGIAIGLGWFFALTIIGLPVAFWIFNRIPAVMTLRGRTLIYAERVADGVTYLEGKTHAQRPLMVRAIYFVLIGWWLGLVWMALAWLISLPIITLPLGVWMMNRIVE